jgi:POT family proton-dependent oligopeptide transporter
MNPGASAQSGENSIADIAPSNVADPKDRFFFGHPAGLLTLFFAEMWERFSYYGMRAILILFMTAVTVQQAEEMIASGAATVVKEVDGRPTTVQLKSPDGSQEASSKPKELAVGGLGFSDAKAGVIYAIYTSMVYFAGLVGGWLADNVTGQRRAVFWGGVVIMFGHISLAFHHLPFFYGGLLLVVIGTGLLKSNIATIVGLLYGPKDVRRDSGFTIYYMGINIGSFFGQTVCGFFAQHPAFKEKFLIPLGIDIYACWHWGFAAAAVGMFLGLVVYVGFGGLMREAGLKANPPAHEAEAQRRKLILRLLVGGIAALAVVAGIMIAKGVTVSADALNVGFGATLVVITLASFARILLSGSFSAQERTRLTVVTILFVASVLFWAAFEQAGGSLNLFADRKSQLHIGSIDVPSSWYQNINPFGIMVLSPLFAYMWLKLGERAPSSPAKFALALLLLGLGFVVAAVGAHQFDATGQRISPLWLTSVYILHTLGELMLSPIGLSLVSKLAPERSVSQVMAIWYLSNANGNFFAGQAVVLRDKLKVSDTQIFGAIAIVTIGAAVVLAVMTRPIKRMMGEIK